MSDIEFTFRWCRSFLERLLAEGYRFRSYDEGVASGDVLLRHDVDLSPERAVRMARMERDLGVSSTYFFLLGTPLYNPFQAPVRDAIREVESLGHDVGLHFSTYQYWPASRPPPESDIAEAVAREQGVLETIVGTVVPTVSFHLPPPWVMERTFEAFPSTFEPRFFGDIAYLADSRQRWRHDGADIPNGGRPLQVLMHPGLWASEDAPFEERIREAVAEADERANDYALSRHLESDRIRDRSAAPPEV